MGQRICHTNISPQNATALSVLRVLMFNCFIFAAWPGMKLSFIWTKAILIHLGETKRSNNAPRLYEKITLLYSSP